MCRILKIEGQIAAEIPDHTGYFVTSYGQVYSIRRVAKSKPPRKLKGFIRTDGYKVFGLVVNGKGVNHYAHRLVAVSWLAPKPGCDVVRHLDGNPLNNIAVNLEWGTQADNVADKTRHGTCAVGEYNGRATHPESTPRGESVASAVLNESAVLDIRRRLSNGELGYILANEYGVQKTTISAIKNRKTWAHI